MAGLVIVAVGVLTAALIAGVTAERSIVTRALEFAPLVLVGSWSYSIYLWHLPIFWGFSDHAFDLATRYVIAGKIVVTLAIAATSYYLAERRFLRLKDRMHPAAPSDPCVASERSNPS